MEPISLVSEVERIRAQVRGATAAESAHQYAERCELRSVQDGERRVAASLRLIAIVSMCAELNRQLSMLEREVLAIADMLRG